MLNKGPGWLSKLASTRADEEIAGFLALEGTSARRRRMSAISTLPCEMVASLKEKIGRNNTAQRPLRLAHAAQLGALLDRFALRVHGGSQMAWAPVVDLCARDADIMASNEHLFAHFS